MIVRLQFQRETLSLSSKQICPFLWEGNTVSFKDVCSTNILEKKVQKIVPLLTRYSEMQEIHEEWSSKNIFLLYLSFCPHMS